MGRKGSGPTDLAASLAALLGESPGQTARELARGLGDPQIKRSEVNSELYRGRGRFWPDGGMPPRWVVVSERGERKREPRARPLAKAMPIAGRRTPFGLYAWQQEALDAWRTADHRGVVEAVTGTGKTRVGLAAIEQELSGGGKATVIVPTRVLQEQWIAELEKHVSHARVGRLGGGSRDTLDDCDVLVGVVNSFRGFNIKVPRSGGLLVADECHRYGSEKNQEALDERFKRRLGLSATYARGDDGNIKWLKPYFGETCFVVDYRRALDDEVTAHFKVALIGVEFEPDERARYDELSDKVSKSQRKLTNAGISFDPFGEFMRKVNEVSKGAQGDLTWAARSFLGAWSKRRQLLAETPSKRAGLEKLRDAIQAAKRVIVFTHTKAGADQAASQLPRAASMHSGLADADRKERIRNFAAGSLQTLTAPKVLDEGVDVPEADLGIILAGSRTRRQMIQRMGRVLRRKDDGRLARFAILYVEGTAEDPKNGAHGEYLEEVTGVAERQRTFAAKASDRSICAFLNAMTPSQPYGAPRMAHRNARRR